MFMNGKFDLSYKMFRIAAGFIILNNSKRYVMNIVHLEFLPF